MTSKSTLVYWLCFTLILSYTSEIFGQKRALNKILEGDYRGAEKIVIKKIEKDNDDLSYLYAYAKLLNTKEYKLYDSKNAYLEVKRLGSLFETSDEKEIKKAINDGISLREIYDLKTKICYNAKVDAINSKDENTLNEFLTFFSEAPDVYKKEVIVARNKAAFINAQNRHTINAYQSFIDQYPGASQIGQAKELRNLLAYEEVVSIDQIASYEAFIRAYPNARQVSLAKSRIQTLAFEDASAINTKESYEAFIKAYPRAEQVAEAEALLDSLFFLEYTEKGTISEFKNYIQYYGSNGIQVSQAIDSLIEISFRQDNVKLFDFLLDLEVDEFAKNNIIDNYYSLLSRDGELRTIDSFIAIYGYPSYLTEDLVKDRENALLAYDLGINSRISYPQDELSYQRYLEQSRVTYTGLRAMQKLIEPAIQEKNFEKAYSMLKVYEDKYGHFLPYQELMTMLTVGVDQSIKPRLITSVNTEGSEYFPVISADDKKLYFVGRFRTDCYNQFREDVFLSQRSSSKARWPKAILSESLSDYSSNDGVMGLSVDGNELIQFIDGQLVSRSKTIEGWSDYYGLSDSVNVGVWNSDAIISSDGNALVYASKRESNKDVFENYEESRSYATHFPTDIYVSFKNENGDWSYGMSLGDSINTRFSDRSPFLHPDMKTLYFSSTGHGGLGGYDVFVSRRLADTCWDCWSKPVNLGKEINSSSDDWGYKISTDGNYAYYSVLSKENRQELKMVNLPISMRPNFVATVSGHLVDSDEQPIEASMRWEDLETGAVIGQSKSDPEDGSYFIVLPLGKLYGYFVDKEDYFPIANNVDLRDSVQPIEYEEDIKVVTFEEMKEDSIAVEINNLFFAFGQSRLLNYSKPELVRLSKIIQQFDLSIQINGHTDNVGEIDNNMLLSEARAQSVKSFLISLGCRDENMTILGHGEEHPIASNETESGRAKNRRVEIVIVD